jgi:aminopeptidase
VLNHEQLEKLAEVMIWGLYTARKSKGGVYKSGDVVDILWELDALSLTEIIYSKLLERGLHVFPTMRKTAKMERDFFTLSQDYQLQFCPSWSKALVRRINGTIYLYAPSSITHLKDVDHKKMAMYAVARKPLNKIVDVRENKGLYGWTLCSLPTQVLADQAQMSLKEYTDEIAKACYLNDADPVNTWQRIFEEGKAIRAWLLSLNVDVLHIESANIDLKVLLGEKRRWLGGDGCNIPSFENFTSPDYRGTQGVYFANMPSFLNGNYVKGVRLVFKDGRAVEVKAEEGEEFTKAQISMDEGACRLGEFSLTDKRHSPITKFMAETLFDENVGGENGNCHIAVGDSYRDTYSGNLQEMTPKLEKELGYNDSSLHWDLINTESKRVTALLKGGGRVVIYENGMFKY